MESMPHNKENEAAALGCMLKDADGAACVFDMLERSDFYDLKHQIIYKAGKALFDRNEPIDLVTIGDELKADNVEKIGGIDFLLDLVDRLPSAADVAVYCKLVIRDSKRRKLLHFAKYVEDGAADLSASLNIEKMQARLDEIAQDRSGQVVRSVAVRLRDKMDREKQREPGELLGYRLNRFARIGDAIDGVQPGFYVFAGVTHVGKTLFLTNVFLDLLKSNVDLHCVYFSLDDNENVIFNRLLAILCGGALTINDLQRRVENPGHARELDGAYNELIGYAKSGRFNILDFSQVQTIETVESVIRGYVRKGKKLFVVIDGLQNIETGKEHPGLREKNVDLATSVKKIVDVYQIPLLTSVEIRKRKDSKSLASMPTIDDIMESSKYGFNASHIWIGHPEGDDYQNFIDYQRNEYQLTVKTVKSKISSAGGPVKMTVHRSYNKLTFAGDGPLVTKTRKLN